jgi:nitrate/nitrite transport system ATP-binding protein
MQKFLSIEDVGMEFDTKRGRFEALRSVNLNIQQGEFISLIGHSGCGKSTLLNMIAGLLYPTSGVVLLSNREVKGAGTDRAVVFQNHSLLPWLTCFENVYLSVERVFAASESKAQLKGTHPRRAESGRSHARRAKTSQRNFRWHEAARRHCPRHRHAAESAAA